MGRKIDITGKRFGRLLVLHESDIKGNCVKWVCVCSCGKEITVDGTALRNGHTKSCGCYSRDASAERSSTHKQSKSNTHRVWVAMKQRCNNPNNINFSNYGGRGVKVCARWEDSFENFLSDMGERPKGMSIDRIDVNGNYEPSNCRWASFRFQQNNRRNNHYITHNGETITISEWASGAGLKYQTLASRLRNGLNIQEALSKPVANTQKKCYINKE